jgi:23S rRNA pseudouridine1911/1915/1917 synthase
VKALEYLPEGLSRGSKPLDLDIQRAADGTRLDLYLVGAFPGYSRSLFQRAIEAGTVQVNGQAVKASYRVRAGDRVRLWLPESPLATPEPEDIPLDVLYEDECLAVINKPANMVVHPARGNWRGTLVNALQFHFSRLSQANGEYRPGIVHRLDRDTSGVILIAKDELAHRDLSLQFEQRRVYKEYSAITQGVLDRDSDYIERAIGHHRNDRTKMAVFDEPDEEEDIKDACTFYEVVERFDGYTFCRCLPKTGRTHQIRVHLAWVGCPVLADKAYSGRDELRLSDLVRDLPPEGDRVLMPRQALHARRLRFYHPRHQRMIEVEAPLPPEFQATLQALREHRGLR